MGDVSMVHHRPFHGSTPHTSSAHRLSRRIAICFVLLLVACRAEPEPPTPTTTPVRASVPPPPVLTAVQSPAATTVAGALELVAETGDTVITLAWQAVPDAKGYYVYRDGNANPLNPTPTTDTRYEDTGLTNGRTYSYTVAVVDQSGMIGLHSAEIQATPKSR